MLLTHRCQLDESDVNMLCGFLLYTTLLINIVVEGIRLSCQEISCTLGNAG